MDLNTWVWVSQRSIDLFDHNGCCLWLRPGRPCCDTYPLPAQPNLITIACDLPVHDLEYKIMAPGIPVESATATVKNSAPYIQS